MNLNKLEVQILFHVFSKVFSRNDESLDLSCAFVDLQGGEKKKLYIRFCKATQQACND